MILVHGRGQPLDIEAPVGEQRCRLIASAANTTVGTVALTRYLQAATGVTIRKLVRTPRPLRSVVIGIDGHQIIADPSITPDARPPTTRHHHGALELWKSGPAYLK